MTKDLLFFHHSRNNFTSMRTKKNRHGEWIRFRDAASFLGISRPHLIELISSELVQPYLYAGDEEIDEGEWTPGHLVPVINAKSEIKRGFGDLGAKISAKYYAGHVSDKRLDEVRKKVIRLSDLIFFMQELEGLKSKINQTAGKKPPSHEDELGKNKPQFSLIRDGAVWNICFDGRSLATCKHLKGFLYIAELLRRPNRPVSAVDLNLLVNKQSSVCDESKVNDAINSGLLSPSGRLNEINDLASDPKSLRAYQAKILILKQKMDSANPEERVEFNQEISNLRKQLKSRRRMLGSIRKKK